MPQQLINHAQWGTIPLKIMKNNRCKEKSIVEEM